MNKELKGKDTFTLTEINELKSLIVERNRIGGTSETKHAQKKIRDKMRKIGFYGRNDWNIYDCQLSDLETLIRDGKIKIKK